MVAVVAVEETIVTGGAIAVKVDVVEVEVVTVTGGAVSVMVCVVGSG